MKKACQTTQTLLQLFLTYLIYLPLNLQSLTIVTENFNYGSLGASPWTKSGTGTLGTIAVDTTWQCTGVQNQAPYSCFIFTHPDNNPTSTTLIYNTYTITNYFNIEISIKLSTQGMEGTQDEYGFIRYKCDNGNIIDTQTAKSDQTYTVFSINMNVNCPINTILLTIEIGLYGTNFANDILWVDDLIITGYTSAPTKNPTKIPTMIPTLIPTSVTNIPSNIPTMIPSKVPTINPTIIPTKLPSLIPSIIPTKASKQPSIVPTLNPTKTNNPTIIPTKYPSIQPTKNPSLIPTNIPTYITTIAQTILNNGGINPPDNQTLNGGKSKIVLIIAIIALVTFLCIIILIFIFCYKLRQKRFDEAMRLQTTLTSKRKMKRVLSTTVVSSDDDINKDIGYQNYNNNDNDNIININNNENKNISINNNNHITPGGIDVDNIDLNETPPPPPPAPKIPKNNSLKNNEIYDGVYLEMTQVNGDGEGDEGEGNMETNPNNMVMITPM